MSKAILQAAQVAYDDAVAQARAYEREGRLDEAIASSKKAWQYVEDMMKFERRWEKREFSSVPCIDMVLRYAPLLLDEESLSDLEALLKSRKSIDRLASDDLAAQLQKARDHLSDARKVWAMLDGRDWTDSAEIVRLSGVGAAAGRKSLTDWQKIGAIEARDVDGRREIRPVFADARPTVAACRFCGSDVQCTCGETLQPRACAKCGKTSCFIRCE